jgi:putative tricarboxylic transport membrane protein
MCVLGSYAIRNSIFDVYLMATMGLLGYVLQRIHIPVAPVVLGLVLGGTLENQYRTALILGEGSYQGFVDSKVALFFFAVTALTVGMQIWSSRRRRPSAAPA